MTLCKTCKHKDYCPIEPKTLIECDKYKVDNPAELSYLSKKGKED